MKNKSFINFLLFLLLLLSVIASGDNAVYAVNAYQANNNLVFGKERGADHAHNKVKISSDEPSEEDFQAFERDTIVSVPQLRDDFNRFNKSMLILNKSLQHKFLNPIARFYKKTVPNFVIRKWILNFFQNLSEPNDAVNALFQLNLRGFLISTTRFLLNSTIGLFGINDFAAERGVRSISTGFGETLAFYKVPPGPYLVIPIIGPSTVREGIGTVIDWLRNPIDFILVKDGRSRLAYIHLGASLLANYAEKTLNLSSQIEEISIDEYAMIHSMYSQLLAKRKTLKQLVDEACVRPNDSKE